MGGARWMAVAGAIGLLAGPAAAQGADPSWMSAPRDWSATLSQDVEAVARALEDTHPGMYDPRNPGFRPQAEAVLAEARARARDTRDAGGWWWAMRALIAGFDDGHVQIGLVPSGGLPSRWPGFLTVYRGADQVVGSRDELDEATPPLGARLIACDGVGADALARQRVGTFRGRWFLEAQKVQFGDWVFMNATNPWTPEMVSCSWEVEGTTRTYPLSWRPIAPADLGARRSAMARSSAPDFGLSPLDDGAYWLSMPSFNGDPESEAYAALTSLLAEVRSRRDDLRAAPYLVLDLRGNGGGSSQWSYELARELWGEAWMQARPMAPIESVDWRASDGNIAAIQAFRDQLAAADGDARMLAWADEAILGMRGAQAAGEPLWRDMGAPPSAPIASAEPTPRALRGPVYVLTDASCASACLDAVDRGKTLDAVQVGRETGADTLYMELRQVDLPSGQARVWLPMKVYRGRARGNNEPQQPDHLFEGDMADQAALQAWIRTLAAGGA